MKNNKDKLDIGHDIVDTHLTGAHSSFPGQ